MNYPFTESDALTALRDALGDNYSAATDDTTLNRALAVDSVSVDDASHVRPWSTAARLIRWNTEYEVDQGLQARIDRKLRQLDNQQKLADQAAGITNAVIKKFGAGAYGGSSGLVNPPSGSVENQGRF